MEYAVQVLLHKDISNLPKSPAVYAIFSIAECRYIGVTDNLHKAILNHLRASEPIVPFRYFMQSSKVKILQYEVLPLSSTPEDWESMKDRWIELYSQSKQLQEV